MKEKLETDQINLCNITGHNKLAEGNKIDFDLEVRSRIWPPGN